MLKMKFWTDEFNDRRAKMRADILRRFGRDEDGSIIIFTIVIMVVMLVIGGMAVDFMRFESRRALLQSVSDRAVLAAAELDQDKDRATVVTDYFEKAGLGSAIIGTPKVEGSGGSKTVTVRSELDISTFYLRFIGIEKLTAPAASSAIEGTGDIEISLVLDISGSMGEPGGALDDDGNPDGRTKLDLLQEAAVNFNNRLLTPANEDQISISLIAYSAHVNVGSYIFDQLNTTPPTLWDTSEWENGEADINTPGATTTPPEPSDDVRVVEYDPFNSDGTPKTVVGTTGDDDDDDVVMASLPVYTSHTNPALCVDIPASEFEKTEWDNSIELQQVEFYDAFGGAAPDETICPRQSYEGIIPLSQDATLLNREINSYEPRTTTSIHDGMKWGVNMLDPSFRTILSGAPQADPAFRNVRPANYATGTSALNTKKFVVLMTDGANFRGWRLKDDDDANPGYDTVLKRRYWSNNAYYQWEANAASSPFPSRTFEEAGVSVTDKNTMLSSICSKAKDAGIIVYAIAMNADAEENPDDGISGIEAMEDCATDSPDGRYFFNTTAEAIDDVFQAIADQIVDLRLSL